MAPTRPDSSTPQRSLNGVTARERALPRPEADELVEMEEEAARNEAAQLSLFVPGPAGSFAPLLGGLPPLSPGADLALARAWFRKELEAARRPSNTIESYSYDLAKLEDRIGTKPVGEITQSDIAGYLGVTTNKSTRKRRLTSVRSFFEFLIERQVITSDPSDGFFPHTIQLRMPMPLYADEQAALLAAAAADEAWSLCAIWLMLRLGLTRGELLALRREHLDLSEAGQPVVHVLYEEIAKRHKERRLAGDAEFAAIYADFLSRKEPVDLLFPLGFQAINGMVDRVRRAAEIERDVTPQTLRHTFAVERVKGGADEPGLLALLGLLDEPRNRESVRRYLALAAPPL